MVLSGVALLVLTEINRRAVERILSDQAEVQAAMAISAVVDGVDGVVGSAERLVRFVARDLEGRALDQTVIEKTARNAILDNPNIFGFALAFEPDGPEAIGERLGVYVHRSNNVSQFVTRDLREPGQAYWEQDWYREVLDKQQAVWSEPYFDRGSGDRDVVRVSIPFFRHEDDDRPSGAISAVIELDWLRRLANGNEFSDTSHVIIFSRSGRLILHPKATYVIAETIETLADKTMAPELTSIRQSIIARRQGSLDYVEGLTGRRMHVSYKPARTAGWGVIVGYEEAEFLQNQRAFRGIALAFLGATLLILSGIVIGVTRVALRPLARLAEAAGEIGRQNLDCEIPPPVRDDEVGHLTRAFTMMRDALKMQHQERRWAALGIEHQLRYNNLIIDSIGELVFVLTKALNITRINPAVTHTVGYTESDAIRLPLRKLVTLTEAGDTGGMDRLLEAAKADRSLHNVAATITAKDGTVLPMRLTLVPIRDGKRVVGAVVTLRGVPPPDSSL